MLKLIKWVKKEVIHLLPAIIYFAVCFNIFHFSQGLMLGPNDTRFTSYLGANLGAIIAAKVILIADCLPFINAFPNKPIIYNITWKFFIYSFFVIFVQAIDSVAQHWYASKQWSVAYNALQADIDHPLFWGVQILVLLFFLIYIVFTEFTRAVGEPKTRKIFFG